MIQALLDAGADPNEILKNECHHSVWDIVLQRILEQRVDEVFSRKMRIANFLSWIKIGILFLEYGADPMREFVRDVLPLMKRVVESGDLSESDVEEWCATFKRGNKARKGKLKDSSTSRKPEIPPTGATSNNSSEGGKKNFMAILVRRSIKRIFA
jgi:hypothetical protein